MYKHAILLSGPIGVGKTSLGCALSEKLGGGFIDGDDHSDPARPWYCSILRTSRAILSNSLLLLHDQPVVVIAYPLRCTTWIFYKRGFDDAGISPIFVNLRATLNEIVSPLRGRRFSADEKARIEVMIQEGYSTRPFADLTIDSGSAPFETILLHLESEVAKVVRDASLKNTAVHPASRGHRRDAPR